MRAFAHWVRAAFVVLGAFLAIAAPAAAQAYLNDIPSPEEIEAAFPITGEGDARLDAAARQEAAFSYFSTIIYRAANKRSKPMTFTPQEQALYDALSDQPKARIRADLGFPPRLCGPDKTCQKYEDLVIDYSWRNKKMSAPLNREIEAAFGLNQKDPRSAALGWTILFMWIAAPVAGFLLARPWGVIYSGEIGSIGSGVVMEGGGLFRMAEVRRNHLQIGRRKIGDFVMTQRMADALDDAAGTGGPVKLGIGRVLHLRWLLSVAAAGRTERAHAGGALLRQIVLIPFFSLVAAVLALIVVSIFAGPYIALAAAFFFIGAGVGQFLTNLRAWMGV